MRTEDTLAFYSFEGKPNKNMKKYLIIKYVIFSGYLILTGCDPTVYKKPAENFKIATTSLKESYFTDLDLSNNATVAHEDLQDQSAIWFAPQGNDDDLDIDKVINKIADRHKQDIHSSIKPLRDKCFLAIESYADIIITLASNDSTEALTTELSGLANDFTNAINLVKNMDLANDYTRKFGKISGPLSQYIDVINEVIKIASDAVREKTIIATVAKSNASIKGMLNILQDEAIIAQENSQDEIQKSIELIKEIKSKYPEKYNNLDNVTKSEIATKLANFYSTKDKITNLEIKRSFTSAIDAQDALLAKSSGEIENWADNIRAFRDSADKLKTSITTLKSEIK